MISPYDALPAEAFWRTGLANQTAEEIGGLYRNRFPIGRATRIATAGSCFAQHIARHLRTRGFSVIDEEPPPPGLDTAAAQRFGYHVYSARYGNIYTARQLRQLVAEARGEFEPVDAVWERGGRYYDAMRPSVEPNGLSSPEIVRDHRAYHLRRVKRVLRNAEVFVLTLGLTEAWEHGASGTVYPTAPGTIAGSFDPAVHRFRNFSFREIHDDLLNVFESCKKRNPGIRFLLSISPVPLTATASGDHVLSATVYSKSVLRAVAGQLCQERSDVDYIPSYELIMSPLSRGQFFEDNLRTVRSTGVEAVMNMFFAQCDSSGPRQLPERSDTATRELRSAHAAEDDVQCDEALLDAFAP